MPKYKSPDGQGINIGGEQFDVDATGCITVPGEGYHSMIAPLGYTLQTDEVAAVATPAVAVDTVVDTADKATSFSRFSQTVDTPVS
jgi:hypothetical protein